MNVQKEQLNPVIKTDQFTNIKYEHPTEFKGSISYETYKKAFIITQEIITENRAYKNSSQKKASGTELRNTEQIYNILFFTGDRGTGKTSTMLSYMEFLKDYYRHYARGRDDEIKGMMFDGDDKIMFTGLEYIDAPSMDQKEDILSTVLSKMLKKWQSEEAKNRNNIESGIWRENDYAYKKRQIHKRFNIVYNYLKNLRTQKDIMDDDNDMFIEILDNMSITMNLKQAFQELVYDYLDIMEYPGSAGKISKDNHFLVISIDDLDLNIDKGFELLDQVRKYLMMPNIILLMSAKYEQLEKLCVNYYTNKFSAIKGEPGMSDYISRLSREYMEKMVPSQRQITLYSGEKWPFVRKKKLNIRYPRAEDGPTGVTLEDVVRTDMKKYLGVEIFPGQKMLYCLTPATLRELVVWNVQVRNLVGVEDLELNEEEQMYNTNLKWFWNVQFSWLIKKYLSPKNQDIFLSADSLNPSAQILFFKKKIESEYGVDSKKSLLETLGILGQRSLEEQRLSSFIILYFSVRLSEIFTSLQWLKTEEKDIQTRKLLRYFDGGVWGIWESNMIKPFYKDFPEEGKSFEKIGYTYFKKENGSLTIELKGTYNERDWNSVSKFLQDNGDILRNYQYLLLFYKLTEGDGPCRWIVSSGNQIQLEKNHSGLFCLSNVILNVVEGAKLVETFINSLPDMLYKGKPVQNQEKKDLIKKLSVLQEGNGNPQWLGEPLIPIGNIEFLISLGMDLQQRLGDGLVDPVNDSSIKSKITMFFGVIKEYLQKLPTDVDYYKRYCEFPPIMQILEEKDAFMDLLVHSISCHAIAYTPSKAEEEWSQ